MSFFKNRAGGSFYRFRAIKGYIKVLFNRKDEEKTEKVKNTMGAKYTVDSEIK